MNSPNLIFLFLIYIFHVKFTDLNNNQSYFFIIEKLILFKIKKSLELGKVNLIVIENKIVLFY